MIKKKKRSSPAIMIDEATGKKRGERMVTGVGS